MKNTNRTLAVIAIILGFSIYLLLTAAAQTDYLNRLPTDAQEYILNEEFPQAIIIPLNELSQEEFNKLVKDLNTTQRLDKQNLIIEAINK